MKRPTARRSPARGTGGRQVIAQDHASEAKFIPDFGNRAATGSLLASRDGNRGSAPRGCSMNNALMDEDNMQGRGQPSQALDLNLFVVLEAIFRNQSV